MHLCPLAKAGGSKCKPRGLPTLATKWKGRSVAEVCTSEVRKIGDTACTRERLAIGAAGSLAVTRLLGSMLFEVKPDDPFTLIGVSLLLIVVALAACYVPARRASRVDPLVALRHE